MQVKSTSTTSSEEEAATGLEQIKIHPYTMVRFSIRSELTRKYYERRIRGFFDYINFEIEIKDMEIRFNDFSEYSKRNINWTLNQIIKFLQFQKQRVETEQITAATLRNFVKSLKVACDSADQPLICHMQMNLRLIRMK
jgi:hypothetical protein